MKCKLIIVLTVFLLLVGCVVHQDDPPPDESDMPVLELWGIGGTDIETTQRIAGLLDELMREKYGFDVNLTMVSRSNYNEQLNLAFLRGEAPDVFVIYQQSAFNDLLTANRLLCLDDYVDEDYFESLAIPDELWPRTIWNEKHWGATQNTETMQSMGYHLSWDVAKEFGVESDLMWTWDELHDLLLRIKVAHPEQYPIVPHYGTTLTYIGQDSLGDNLGVLLDERQKDTTVENLYASDLYYEFCNRMHQWYQEGLILPDAYDSQINGNIQIATGLGVGMFQRFGFAGTSSYAALWLLEPSIDTFTNYLIWGVSAKSSYPQESVILLQALFTDLDVGKLLILGEEEIDYQLIDSRTGMDGNVKVLDNNWSGTRWAWPTWQPLREHYDVENWLQVPVEAEFIPSPAYGFVFDASNLETQILRCQEIVNKYHGALSCGFLEPDAVIPLFLQELEEAGINDIITEKQRQLDAWLMQKDFKEHGHPIDQPNLKVTQTGADAPSGLFQSSGD